MESEKTKLFVGGISRETGEDDLRYHFSKYGTVLGSLVARDKNTRCSRGFGFVWLSDSFVADKALHDSHVILGRTVEVKKAIPKNEMQPLNPHTPCQLSTHRYSKNGSDWNASRCFTSKKIFVGGLSSNLTKEQFRTYFEQFGRIVDVVVIQDSITNRPRGFGFVTFDSDESVHKALLSSFHELNGKLVEVKRAVPRENGSHKGKAVGPTRYRSRHKTPSELSVSGYAASSGSCYGSCFYGVTYPAAGYEAFGFYIAPWDEYVMMTSGFCPPGYGSMCFYPAYVSPEVKAENIDGRVLLPRKN